MSSSTAATDQSAEASTVPTQATPAYTVTSKELAQEKKKLKVLKNALKEERVHRTQIEKDLQQAQEKIDQYKQQLADKVGTR